MARVDINLDEELVDDFQMVSGRRLGAKRGAFTWGIKDSMILWKDSGILNLIDKHGSKFLSKETLDLMKRYPRD